MKITKIPYCQIIIKYIAGVTAYRLDKKRVIVSKIKDKFPSYHMKQLVNSYFRRKLEFFPLYKF